MCHIDLRWCFGLNLMPFASCVANSDTSLGCCVVAEHDSHLDSSGFHCGFQYLWFRFFFLFVSLYFSIFFHFFVRLLMGCHCWSQWCPSIPCMTCLWSPQPPSEMTDMRCQRCGRWLYLFAACLHLASTNMCRSQRFVRQVGAMSSAEVMHGTSDGAGERDACHAVMHVLQSEFSSCLLLGWWGRLCAYQGMAKLAKLRLCWSGLAKVSPAVRSSRQHVSITTLGLSLCLRGASS